MRTELRVTHHPCRVMMCIQSQGFRGALEAPARPRALSKAQEPVLPYREFAKMQACSPLEGRFQQGQRDGLSDSPGNSTFLPSPVLDLSRTRRSHLSLSTR